MVKKFSKLLKNQRGLTLVELLAVVVILGIISAIAVPSIGGLINNSKKDAHIANAQTMANAVKLMVTSEDELTFDSSDNAFVTLTKLETDNYIEAVKDPSGEKYGTETGVAVTKDNKGNYSYSVKLTNSNNKIYYEGSLGEMKRAKVNLNPTESSTKDEE